MQFHIKTFKNVHGKNSQTAKGKFRVAYVCNNLYLYVTHLFTYFFLANVFYLKHIQVPQKSCNPKNVSIKIKLSRNWQIFKKIRRNWVLKTY